VQIDLVPCSQDDRDFAFRVTEEAMRTYVEEAFGAWDAVGQRQRLNDSFNPSSWNVVLVDGEPGGILVVEDRSEELFLSRIFLLPTFQGRGVGTVLMQRVITRANLERKPLRLRVLRVNTSARRLYERLGFVLIRSTTEHDYLEMLPRGDRRPSTEQEIRAAHVGEVTPLRGHVLLVDYDPRWPGLFEREAVRIRRALDARALRVEHVGSTSVPALAAKSVIDIVLVVTDSAHEGAYVPALEAAGYRLHVREPDWHQHRMFKGSDPDVNLHTFSAGCAEVDRMLAFRNWLRTNAADRELYARTKRDLAQRDWTFGQNYADAKNDVVDQIMARARSAGGAPVRSLRFTRAFCVGQAKSGTASLCGLLSGAYRAAHEPERAELLGVILREAHGEMTAEDVRAWLVERDERLALEYDIAWANQFLVGHLVDVFPEARFVVLIRDPYTWFGSVVGHLLSREIPAEVRAFLDWWFRPREHRARPGDEALIEAGLYSVDAFLAAWNRHLDTCRAALPSARTLALRTHELRRSHARLAEFLAIPADTLSVERGHLNQRTWTGSLEDLVPLEHLESSVARRCEENLRRYFPEIRSLEDAMALEDSGRNRRQ
jgi:GrpB-like predicted nucleotidyltransferase (UPF0157 family)/GNAT superfamily N-acetyltransferase